MRRVFLKTRRENAKGFTLIEVIIAVASFAMIVPAVVYALSWVRQGLAADEAKVQLTEVHQKAVNQIHLRLTRNKRLFQQNALDQAFLNAVQRTAEVPPPMGDSKLPVIEPDGSIAPEAGSDFYPASFGNSLFFLHIEEVRELKNLVDAAGNTEDFRVDIYRFYHYYLTANNPKGLRDRPSYRLVEWKSVPFADYKQLYSLLTGTTPEPQKWEQALEALVNAPADPVSFLVDTGAVTLTDAFYAIQADFSGNVTYAGAGNNGTQKPATVTIAQASWRVLTHLQTGIMGMSYRYGVSPNTSGWVDAPRPVPLFAQVSADFPGGFEVGVVGPPSGRKVLLRSVWVAQGPFPKPRASELTLVTSAKDIW